MSHNLNCFLFNSIEGAHMPTESLHWSSVIIIFPFLSNHIFSARFHAHRMLPCAKSSENLCLSGYTSTRNETPCDTYILLMTESAFLNHSYYPPKTTLEGIINQHWIRKVPCCFYRYKQSVIVMWAEVRQNVIITMIKCFQWDNAILLLLYCNYRQNKQISMKILF